MGQQSPLGQEQACVGGTSDGCLEAAYDSHSPLDKFLVIDEGWPMGCVLEWESTSHGRK